MYDKSEEHGDHPKEDDEMENINDFMNGWYGRLEDLVDELNENGFEVLDYNQSYIVVDGGEDEDENDIQYILHLAGTERTIVVEYIDTELI